MPDIFYCQTLEIKLQTVYFFSYHHVSPKSTDFLPHNHNAITTLKKVYYLIYSPYSNFHNYTNNVPCGSSPLPPRQSRILLKIMYCI